MAEIIKFPRLARDEIVEITIEGIKVKCKILNHEGNDTYKLKALNGKHKGMVGYFKINDYGNL